MLNIASVFHAPLLIAMAKLEKLTDLLFFDVGWCSDAHNTQGNVCDQQTAAKSTAMAIIADLGPETV